MLPTAQLGMAEHTPELSSGPVSPIVHTASPLASAGRQERAPSLIHEGGQAGSGMGGRVLRPHPPASCSPEV